MREPRTVTPFLAAYMLTVPHVVEASKPIYLLYSLDNHKFKITLTTLSVTRQCGGKLRDQQQIVYALGPHLATHRDLLYVLIGNITRQNRPGVARGAVPPPRSSLQHGFLPRILPPLTDSQDLHKPKSGVRANVM